MIQEYEKTLFEKITFFDNSPFEKMVSQRDRGMNGFQKTAPSKVGLKYFPSFLSKS